jgi:hypothetical protein
VKCGPVWTRLRAAIASFAHPRGHGNCSGRRERYNIRAGERKRVHERRRQRAHGGHEREHSDGNSRAGPAGRCADPSQYVFAPVRCALLEPNGTLWRTQRVEGLTVHVQGRRPSRRLPVGLQIDGDRHVAVAQLREIRGDLLCARVIALQLGLSDTHVARAHQLVDRIAAALTPVIQPIEGEGL